MSMRVHFTEEAITVSVFTATDTDMPEPYQWDDDPDGIPASFLRLVIEDEGNCEALVIDMQRDEMQAFVADIAAKVERAAADADADQAATLATMTTCRHCERGIVKEHGIWIDPEATGDDRIWRETCGAHDTMTAEHEPVDAQTKST